MATLQSGCTFLNEDDRIRVRLGLAIEGSVRTTTMASIRVERRNMLSVLPRALAIALGASYTRTVMVRTRKGVESADLCDNLAIHVQGRKSTFPCLAVDGAVEAVLGRTAMLALGLEIASDETVGLIPEPYIRI